MMSGRPMRELLVHREDDVDGENMYRRRMLRGWNEWSCITATSLVKVALQICSSCTQSLCSSCNAEFWLSRFEEIKGHRKIKIQNRLTQWRQLICDGDKFGKATPRMLSYRRASVLVG